MLTESAFVKVKGITVWADVDSHERAMKVAATGQLPTASFMVVDVL